MFSFLSGFVSLSIYCSYQSILYYIKIPFHCSSSRSTHSLRHYFFVFIFFLFICLFVCIPGTSRFIFIKFEPEQSKLTFDLTVTSDDLYLTNLILYGYFILPATPTLLSPSMSPIEASWNLTWPWPQMTFTNLILNVYFILPATPALLSPSMNLIRVSWNLTWPLTLGLWPRGPQPPNKHKLALPQTNLHPPTKFQNRTTLPSYLMELWSFCINYAN